MGTKWIRWNGHVVEITGIYNNVVSYKYITGRLIGIETNKNNFLDNFEPYNEP